MNHRFKTIDGAVRRIRRLEKLLKFYDEFCRKQDNKLTLLAKLASKTPAFFNPLEAMAAEKLRDEILSKSSGGLNAKPTSEATASFQ